MNLVQILMTVLISAVIACGTMLYANSHREGGGSLETATQESAYDRVMRTKTVRCGYIINPPYALKDANTGAMSGLAYDYVEAIAHELEFQVEWTEETGWGTFHEGLNANRYDVMCVPIWQSGARTKIALLTEPLYYNSMFAYARTDDNRFDENLDAANKPEVRVAVADGDTTQAIRRMLLPSAQELAISQINGSAEMIMDVSTKKADLLFDIPDQIDRFNANSTEKLKTVNGGKPVRFFANALTVKRGEFELKAMLDSTIEAINTDGTAAQIIKKYGPSIRADSPGYSP